MHSALCARLVITERPFHERLLDALLLGGAITRVNGAGYMAPAQQMEFADEWARPLEGLGDTPLLPEPDDSDPDT